MNHTLLSRSLAILWLVLLTVPAAGAATPAATLHLTLQQVIGAALADNPRLQAATHRSAAAEREAAAAARQRWGRLTAVAWASRYQDDQLLRPMAEELLSGGFAALPWNRDQFHYGLTYRLPLFLGGKLDAHIALAHLAADQAQALLAGTRWQVRFNAVSLYASAQTLDTVLTALDRQIAALTRTRDELDLAVRSGKRPEVDRLKVVAALEDARARREQVAANRARVGALLLAVMGREENAAVTVEPLPTVLPDTAVTTADLLPLLEETSPVCDARLAVRRADARKKLARAEFLPSLTVGANVMEHTADNVDGPLQTWELRAGVTLPLFTGGARFAALAAAREGRYAADQRLRGVRLQQRAALTEAVAGYRAARARVTAADSAAAAAREAARIEQIRYDTGAGDVEDLLAARAREAGALAARAQARGDLLTAAARINATVEKEVIR